MAASGVSRPCLRRFLETSTHSTARCPRPGQPRRVRCRHVRRTCRHRARPVGRRARRRRRVPGRSTGRTGGAGPDGRRARGRCAYRRAAPDCPGRARRRRARSPCSGCSGDGGLPRLLLPVPGDVRGLPARLGRAGAGAGCGSRCRAARRSTRSRSGERSLAGVRSVRDAPSGTSSRRSAGRRADLDAAIRQATARLPALDVARGGQDARSRIADADAGCGDPDAAGHVEGNAARGRRCWPR